MTATLQAGFLHDLRVLKLSNFSALLLTVLCLHLILFDLLTYCGHICLNSVEGGISCHMMHSRL